MAINYEKIAKTAERLILESGRSITLVRPSETPIDATKPWNGSQSSEETLTLPGVQLLPNAVRVFGLSALGDATELRGLLELNERVYIVFQGTADISTFNFVRDGGIDYQIQGTQELKPGDVILLGFIGVRR